MCRSWALSRQLPSTPANNRCPPLNPVMRGINQPQPQPPKTGPRLTPVQLSGSSSWNELGGPICTTGSDSLEPDKQWTKSPLIYDATRHSLAFLNLSYFLSLCSAFTIWTLFAGLSFLPLKWHDRDWLGGWTMSEVLCGCAEVSVESICAHVTPSFKTFAKVYKYFDLNTNFVVLLSRAQKDAKSCRA